jgi:hypothetical protein
MFASTSLQDFSFFSDHESSLLAQPVIFKQMNNFRIDLDLILFTLFVSFGFKWLTRRQMQFFWSLFAGFAICIAGAKACFVFDAIYNFNTTKISGTTVDNGQTTCTFSGTVEKDENYSFYASCIEGFASYISANQEVISYSSTGQSHIYPIAKDIHSPGPRNQYYTLSARIGC